MTGAPEKPRAGTGGTSDEPAAPTTTAHEERRRQPSTVRRVYTLLDVRELPDAPEPGSGAQEAW